MKGDLCMMKMNCGIVFFFCFIAFTSLVFSADAQWIGTISVSPPAPVAGDTVTLTASFQVLGEGGIDNLRVTGGYGDTIVHDRTWAHIEEGATRRISFTWPASEGEVTFFAQIDPDNRSSDSDRSNNRLERTLTVASRPRAALDFSHHDMTPPYPAPGDTIHITLNLFSRRAPSSNVNVRASVDDVTIYNQTFVAIPQDGSVAIDIPWTAVAGRHRFSIWVNPGTPAMWFEIDISALPDLQYKSASVTLDRNNPNKYFYAVTFKNAGSRGVFIFNWKADYPPDPTQCKTCPQGRQVAVAPRFALGPGEEKTLRGFILRSDFRYESRYPSRTPGCEEVWNVVEFIIDPYGGIEESNEHNNGQGQSHYLRWDICSESRAEKPTPKK